MNEENLSNNSTESVSPNKIKKVVKKKVPKTSVPPLNKQTNEKKSKLVPFLIFIIILLISSLGFLGYKIINEEKNSSTSNLKKEANTVYSAVSKLYLFTDKEKPKIQKITKTNAETKKYFVNAKKDDYLLLFNNQKIAILYRKEINKIIGIKPLIQTSDSPSSVAVLYGGGTLDSVAEKIKTITALQIIASGDATKTYPKTVVVGSKENPYSVQIAAKLGMDLVDVIPEGETIPGELKSIGTLIIIGEDNK